MVALLGVIIVLVVGAVLPTHTHTQAAAVVEDQGGGRPCCFHACFDQCVLRQEFWFCQFSCYHRCAAGGGSGSTAVVRAPAPAGRDCEHACARSMCGQLRPGTKMMAACRDTCRKSYAPAACPTSSSSAP